MSDRKPLPLTDANVERKCKPDPTLDSVIFWDKSVSGFGLRVSRGRKDPRTGQRKPHKRYIVQKSVGGKVRRVTLGTHGQINAQQARVLALETLAKLEQGVDPNEGKRRIRKLTLEWALELHLKRLDAQEAQGATKEAFRDQVPKAPRRLDGAAAREAQQDGDP